MLVKQIKESVDFLVDEILMGIDDDKGSIIWRNFIRRTRPYEVKFTKVLKGLFRQQEAEVLANMRKHPKAVSIAHNDIWPAMHLIGYIDPEVTNERVKQNWLSEWLFAEMMWRKRFEKEARPFIGGVFETVGEAQLSELVIGIDFDINNPRAQKWLGTRLEEYSKSVNGTTLDSIKRTLREGVAAGESIPELQKRVQKVFDGCNKYRAQMISRTETITASNQGSLEAMRQSGVVEKKIWYCALDERTCELCMSMHEEEVGLDKNFSGGISTPSAHPSCRCTILSRLKE